MKLYFNKLLLILLVGNFWFGILFSQIQNPTQILNEMITVIRNIKTIQFSIVQTERFKGMLENQMDAIKMQVQPLKIYISAESPGKSYEVLWIAGENKGDAWVHPGGFPYFTLSLNPEGNTMKLGHHSIFALNLNYFADLIRDVMKKDGENFEKIAQYQGLYDVDGRLCYKVLLDYPTFKLNPYVVMPGEDLVTIAEKNHVSEYMIFERNKNIKNYTDIKAGQTILVPERYAKSIVLFIDKELKLPIIEMMYDDLGLFERYEFKKLKLNPNFSDKEFTKECTVYHF
jgi:outer membrane lipoprotein-sorting protein